MRKIAASAVVLVLLVASARAQEVTAGLLQVEKGTATVIRGGVRLPVAGVRRLHLGDRIVLSPGAKAVVRHYAHGDRFGLVPGPAATIAKDQVLLETRPTRPATLIARGASLVLAAGPTENARRLFGTMARALGSLRSPEPYGATREAASAVTLQWKSRLSAGKTPLTLTIRRDGEPKPILTQALPQDATAFSVPAGLLEPGILYQWRVEIVAPGVGAAAIAAPLWVLTDDDRAALLALEQSAGTGAAGDLIRASALANIGLLRESLAVWRTLEAADPKNADIAEAIAKLTAALPRDEEAQ
jgi:hypothetical protein